jgi:hypothetical protein
VIVLNLFAVHWRLRSIRGWPQALDAGTGISGGIGVEHAFSLVMPCSLVNTLADGSFDTAREMTLKSVPGHRRQRQGTPAVQRNRSGSKADSRT